MNRDTIVVSSIGFSLGIIAAIILLVAPQFLANRLPQKNTDLISPDTGLETVALEVNTPTDGSIVQDKTVTIEGNAKASNLIVVTSPIDETVTTVADDGSFGVSITAEIGENEIQVTNYDPDGSVSDTELITITYSAEQL